MKYFATSAAFWLVIDFSTTGGIRNPSAYYGEHMPALLLFYLGFPLLFTLLIYWFSVTGKWLFAAAVAEMLLVEVVFTGNALLFTFPVLLAAIPAGVAIYSLITFGPKWIAEKDLRRHAPALALMVAVTLAVVAANVAS